MSDNQEKKQASSLAPIKEKDRIMNWGSNTMLWLGGCISIGTLTMGSAQLEKGLNLIQLFAAVFLGSLILVIGIALNDQFSYKTGAPYAIQLKSAFGTKGSMIPVCSLNISETLSQTLLCQSSKGLVMPVTK